MWARVTPLLASCAGILVAAGPSPAAAYTLKVLHSFCADDNCEDGTKPFGSVLLDPAGNLYGTTGWGGKTGGGVVYALKQRQPGKWEYNILHDFCRKSGCADGSLPVGNLILSTSGALYGATNVGGKLGYGTIYRLTEGTGGARWSLKLLHSFCGPGQCLDASLPFAGLAYTGGASGSPYDEVSPLYGLTLQGGAYGRGTAFQLKPRSDRKRPKETVTYDFCAQPYCSDGSNPFGSMAPNLSGNFFGSAGGGTNNRGVVFELAPSRKQKISLLYSFCSVEECRDGDGPGDLLLDAQENIFGTTIAGGTCNADANGCGVVFKLVQGSQAQETVIYNFCSLADCADGRNGSGLWGTGTLIENSGGTLFGTTPAGGGHDIDHQGVGGGVVFALRGSALEVLHAFCEQANCADGEQPLPKLTMDSAGDLFGVTYYGGAHGAGEVFEISPS